MPSEFKLYPSGFVGPADLKQSEPTDVGQLAHALMDRTRQAQIEHTTYALQAEEYGRILLSDGRLLNEFATQEKVVKFAKQAFTDLTVWQWVEMQYRSPEFTAYHNSWLEETFRFIYNGQRRTYMPQVWLNLVSISSTAVYTGKAPSRQLRDYLESEPAMANMRDLLLRWIQHQDGINDVVGALYVLYGPRSV